MTQKSSAIGKPNWPCVYYWGKKDPELFIPTRSSLSLTLEGINQPLEYKVTLELSPKYERDVVLIDGIERKDVSPEFERALDILRSYTNTKMKAKVAAHSTFPVASGLASSAAMAQSLAFSYYSALGVEIDPYTLSKRARRISGSGCRLHSGWNVWNKGNSDEDSFAVQLYDENWWPEVRILIAIIEPGKKKISSRVGMETTVKTCPSKLYDAFVDIADLHIEEAKKAIQNKDISLLGNTYRNEYEFFKLVRLETKPKIEYETPLTYKLLSLLAELREDGIPAYGGTQAGPNVNILTLQNYLNSVEKRVKNVGVQHLIYCKPGKGVELTDKHLL